MADFSAPTDEPTRPTCDHRFGFGWAYWDNFMGCLVRQCITCQTVKRIEEVP